MYSVQKKLGLEKLAGRKKSQAEEGESSNRLATNEIRDGGTTR